VAIEAAGGMDDGAVGTDAERVRAAVELVRSPDGVLILMDLGSALMSAEMATEMIEPAGGPVLLSAAPLVEGAVAAAARARGGGSLDEVAAEARGALRMKTSQLGEDSPEAGDSAAPATDESDRHDTAPAGEHALELTLTVENRHGLHARPAARFIAALTGLDVLIEVRNLTRGTGPADGRSLTGLAILGVRQGDEISVHARGAHAREALDALRALAAENFGDSPDDETSRAPRTGGSPADASPAAAARPGARLRGAPASDGIAIGLARRLVASEPPVADHPEGPPAEERALIAAARAAVRADLEAARTLVQERGSVEEAEIFTAHTLLLDDAALVGPAEQAIDEGVAAGRAWQAAAAAAAASFRELDDPYPRERAVDVEDVARRVLAQLAGVPAGSAPQGPGIVIADELTPGEAAGLDHETAWAIATARGGPTGHAAILARALGIPAVVGLGPALLAIPEGTALVLDGAAGTLEVEPDAETIAQHERTRDAEAASRASLLARAGEPGAMRDGRRVEIFANVGSLPEAPLAVAQCADSVGLLRTEFL